VLRMDQVYVIRHKVLMEGLSQRRTAEKHQPVPAGSMPESSIPAMIVPLPRSNVALGAPVKEAFGNRSSIPSYSSALTKFLS